MLKKVIIIVLSIIGVLSLALNYFAINNVIPRYINEEKRSKDLAQKFAFFGFGDSKASIANKDEELNLSVDDKEFLSVIDTAIHRILIMQDELISTSGGINPENGVFVNAYGIHYVEQYFYNENYYQNNAIEYFNKTIKDYTEYMRERGFNSSLVNSVNLYEKYISLPLFKEMSITETMVFMDLLKSHILLDKYIYLEKQCSSY